jgi:hypothetical protein
MRALLCVFLFSACDGGGGPSDAGPIDEAPSDTCGSVRLTSYTAQSMGWCELDRTHSSLPMVVREGLTAAIGEPWNGGSYGGEPGEACGECWEIDTINATRIVMIADLCPIVGNPLCAGAHFHIDLASEAASALMGGGLDEAQARRVPCPVSGNIHLQVNDENVTYMRLQFLNHRLPIREAAVRAAGEGAPPDAPWLPLRRSGGAWEAIGEGMDLARGGTGVVFRVTSAQGQSVESTAIVPAHPSTPSFFDLGVQLDDTMPSAGGACVFVPPRTLYDDAWGGIDQVRWDINPWGAAESSFYGEVSEDCYGESASCVRIDRLDQWTGFHLYYRQGFPTSTFSRIVLQARTVSGQGMISVSPSNDAGERCMPTTASVGPEYTEIVVDIAAVCGGVSTMNAVTVDNPGPNIALLIDAVRFED